MRMAGAVSRVEGARRELWARGRVGPRSEGMGAAEGSEGLRGGASAGVWCVQQPFVGGIGPCPHV